MIVIGFVQDVIEAQIRPQEGSHAEQALLYMDIVVSAFYTLELFCNISVHSENCFQPFYSNANNWFDLFTVMISIVSVLLSLYNVGQSIPLKMLRLIRVIRVAKLFKGFRAMDRMVTSVGFCLVPMMNAFFLLFIITIIYAVMGVTLLKDTSPQYFKNFQTALFSLFQVVAGDSWASAITRSMFKPDENGVLQTNPSITMYFVSYVIIGNFLM